MKHIFTFALSFIVAAASGCGTLLGPTGQADPPELAWSIEAEDAITPDGDGLVVDDISASGGSLVHGPPGFVNAPVRPALLAAVTSELPAGRYEVWGRLTQIDDANNDCFVFIDGVERGILQLCHDGAWWTNRMRSEAPGLDGRPDHCGRWHIFAVELDAGVHVVEVVPRGGDLLIDVLGLGP